MINIIIPALGFEDMTKQCIESVKDHCHDEKYELLVVDNGGDFNMKGIPTVKGKENWSFAHSCNAGALLKEKGDFLFLNNDTVATSDFVTEMARVLEMSHVGVVGALLLYPNGRIQHAGASYNKGDPNHPHKHQKLGHDTDVFITRAVEAVTFACALVERKCWERLDGLDEENFPFGYEDTDFCLRAWQAGWRVYYCAEARLIHREHMTQRKHLSRIKKKSDISINNLRERWG